MVNADPGLIGIYVILNRQAMSSLFKLRSILTGTKKIGLSACVYFDELKSRRNVPEVNEPSEFPLRSFHNNMALFKYISE